MLNPSSSKREFKPSLGGQRAYYVFWARNAIYHGLKVLQISAGDSVLVPSFHCAAAVEPILRYGAKVKFYNIRRDCSPDFDDLQAKIDTKTRAVMAIHYFGFPQPIRKFKKFCEDHHLYLIEDCAHVLSAEADGAALGTFGDISVFSWRKFLPIYDGGHLVINNRNLHAAIALETGSVLFSLKVAKNVFDKLIEDSPIGAVRAVAHLSRIPYAVVRRLLRANGHQPGAVSINSYSLDFDPSTLNLKMSALSQHILQNIDISSVIEKRRRNYAYLVKALESLPGITPLHSLLPKDACPWAFPVLIDGRQNFHAILRAKGIPAFTWGGVIHPQLPLEAFPDAAYMYENLVLLPLHQDLNERAMQTMVQILAEA
jgi:dTDP-4-amino-4,6-dideoxygalactose transaminase